MTELDQEQLFQNPEPKLEKIGVILRNKRQAMNHTVESVVNEIKIRKSIIEGFEADDITALNIENIYLIGYFRNYVNFLDLDHSLIERFKEEIIKIEKQVVYEAPFVALDKETTQVVTNNNYKFITLLVIIGFLGYVGYQMFQKNYNNSSLSSNINLIDNVTSKDKTKDETTVTQPTVEPVPEVVPEPVVEPTPAAEPTPEVVPEATPVEEPKVEETTKVVEPVVAEPVKKEEPDAVNHPALLIKTTRASWISVKDAKSTLAARNFAANGEYKFQKLTYPVALIIGSSVGVKLFFNGKPYKITPGKNGIARINLTSAP